MEDGKKEEDDNHVFFILSLLFFKKKLGPNGPNPIRFVDVLAVQNWQIIRFSSEKVNGKKNSFLSILIDAKQGLAFLKSDVFLNRYYIC